MAGETAPTTSKGCLGLVGRVVVALVLVGVALAVLRYLGQGVGIGTPGWIENVADSLSSAADWLKEVLSNIFGRGDSANSGPPPASGPTSVIISEGAQL